LTGAETWPIFTWAESTDSLSPEWFVCILTRQVTAPDADCHSGSTESLFGWFR
jgi:hypothetical protein